MARSPSEQPNLSGMRPVEPAALPTPPALPAYPPAPNPYLRTPLPPQHQLQPDTLRQFYQTGFPQTRIVPLPPTANATINASAHGIAKSVATQIVNHAISQLPISVGLAMPREFVVSNSPVTGVGTLTAAWGPEASGTIFAGPPAGVTGFDAAFGASGGNLNGGTATTTGGAPSQSGEWALYAGGIQTSSFTSNPAGWTALAQNSLARPQLVQQIPSGATSVSVSQSFTTTGQWSTVLAYFGGTLPTFVQSKQTSNGGTSSISASFTSATGAGHAVLVILEALLSVSTQNPFLPAASDTQGLTPYFIGSAVAPFSSSLGAGIQTTVFLFQGTANASETITLQFPQTSTAVLTIYEMTAPTAVNAVPRFIPTPPVNVSNATGILSILNGGAGVSLAATGGPSRVLQQTSAGATITVGQLAASDLSNGTTGSGAVVLAASPTLTGTAALPIVTMTGKVTKYNNIATVSNGIPAEYATVDNTTASANIGLTTLYAVPAAGAGLYRVSVYLIVNRVATSSSTLPDLNLQWTDQDNSTVQSATFVSASPSTNTLTTMFAGTQVISAKASTNIQYQTGDSTAYASVGATTMQYSVHLKLEAL